MYSEINTDLYIPIQYNFSFTKIKQNLRATQKAFGLNLISIANCTYIVMNI